MSSVIAHVAETDGELSGSSARDFEELASHGAELREEARSHALRLLNAGGNGPSNASLPILATAGDVREAVQYLRKKPTGVSVVEALNDQKARL